MSVGARDPRIDTLRGVSILLVLLHHFSIGYHLPATPLGTLVSPGLVRAVVRNGNYAVTLFFVISGFLITSNALRRWGGLDRVSVRGFYALRIARIVPCLLLLLVVVAALGACGLAMFRTVPADPGKPALPLLVYAAALGFFMNVVIERLGWVNYPLGVLWSLSVEEVFYLSFPLLCLLRRPAVIAAVWVAVAVAGPLWRAAHQGDEGGMLYAFPAAADGIAIGCLAALLAASLAARMPIGWRIPGPVRIATALAMAALYLSASISVTNIWGVSAMAIGGAVLLLPAGAATAGAPSGSLRGLRWAGRLSYELYLFHLVVLGLLREIWAPGTVGGGAVLVLLAVFLALSALLAAGIGRFFANPANAALRRYLAAPSAPVSASDASVLTAGHRGV